MVRRWTMAVMAVSVLAVPLWACDDDPAQTDDAGVDAADDTGDDAESEVEEDVFVAPEGTAMRFEPEGDDFFDVPFPDDVRRGSDFDDFDGVFSSWPGAAGQSLLQVWFDAADDLLSGWGLNSAVFAYFTDAVDASTLSMSAEASVDFEDGAPSVFLVDVDPESDRRGQPRPVTCQFRDQNGSYHDAYQLGCISPFGVVRSPDTRYAMVITDQVLDEQGQAVVADEAMAHLLRGEDAAGVSAEPYQEALDVVGELGVEADAVASMVLFTTQDPSQRLRAVNDWYDELPTPQIDEQAGLSVVDVYDDFVVLEGYYDVPVIQRGERPYDDPPEGEILFDGDVPQMVDEQSIRFYVTVPRMEMPEEGFGTLFYLHGSGGIAEQLMDRGAESESGDPPEPGTGPAGVVAPYGVAGFAADFNLHGMRHDPPDNLGLMFYNLIDNPRAAIENFTIAANEITLHGRLMEALEVDVADVDGLAEHLPEEMDTIRFDADGFALFGQSMGSTIGLPALTVDSTIGAGVFSGSGGVLIEVALESTEPIPVGDVLRLTLNYANDEELDPYDPILSAVQHVWDLVDPVSHGRFLFEQPHPGVEPAHALQHSGLDDAYFSARSRAAFSMAMGGQLVEPVQEPEALEQMRWRGLEEVMDTPVSGNRDGMTAVVTQYEPSVLDGHHVGFQRDDAKAQYACFVRSLVDGQAPVLRSAEESAPEECLAE